MNEFHVVGSIFACWAVLLFVLGITRENWPGSATTERLVAAISVALALAAVGSAIYSANHEKHETKADAAVFLPR